MNTSLDREQKLVEIIEADKKRLFMIAGAYERGEQHSDLCKEILLEIWNGLENRGERAGPGIWIYRVALNIAIAWKSDCTRPALVCSRRYARANLRNGSDPRAAVDSLYEFMYGLQMTDRAVFLSCLDVFSCREMAQITELDEAKLRARSNRLKSDFCARYIGA